MFALLDRVFPAKAKASPPRDDSERVLDSGVNAENVEAMREVVRSEIDGKRWIAVDDPLGQFARRR